ncbi:MAG: hypothetical protein ACP5C3_08165 [Methanomicrobiales archaeon]
MNSYTIEDYQDLIIEIADIEIEADSIAESRHLLKELDKRKLILLELRKVIAKEIRLIESEYLEQRKNIREKYSQNNSSGISNIFRGEPRKKRTTDMKKLNKTKKLHLEPYYDLKYQIDDLLEQIDYANLSLSNYIKESFKKY